MSIQHSRRRFLQQTAAFGAGLTLLGNTAGAAAANDRLQLASIGVGGMGGSDLGQFLSHPKIDIVALCDIDQHILAKAAERVPKAKIFTDWRELLEKMGDSIDAVNVATPDHTHAPASMSAINLGKHVYCQKPLTHDVHEARQLRLAAKKQGVVTQMGIQIHSHHVYRTAVKTIRDGAIGKVKEIHSWSNKKWGYSGSAPIPAEVPKGVHWDQWIGTAPMRPFSPGHYHRANWRKWVDFGCGTMGDMGIHILDPVASAVDLALPISIISYSPEPPQDSHGMDNKVEYTFAGTDLVVPGFKLTWYDGSMSPDSSEWPVSKLPGQGSMFVGEKGYMLLPHIGNPQLLPKEQFQDYQLPMQQGANHYHLWANACLGEGKTSASFDYAGPLTETLLLGVIANRFPTQRLDFDAQQLQITNFQDADKMIQHKYRSGWEVTGLS